MSDEKVGLGKEVLVTYYKKLSWHLPENSLEKLKN